jgi:replicative DNA helicase
MNTDENGMPTAGLAEIILAKHRNGATDSIWLRFRGKYAKFQNEDDAIDPEELGAPIPPAANENNSYSIQSRADDKIAEGYDWNSKTPNKDAMGNNIETPF